MPFVYDNLWKLLVKHGMTKEELRIKIRASQTTIVNLGKNKNVSLDVIDRICEVLKCTPNDIMEFSSNVPLDSSIHPNRGEIYMANFTIEKDDTNFKAASPVVILQTNISSINSTTVFIAPLSSRIPKSPQLNCVLIQSNQAINGLAKDSIVLIDKIMPIPKFSLLYKVGELSVDDMKKIENIICVFFGLDS